MTTIVVDANIILSAILSPFGIIPKIIITGSSKSEFALPDFALEEVELHKKKICRYGGISLAEFDILFKKLLEHMVVFTSDEIRPETLSIATDLTKNVDLKDTAYVAMCIELNGLLWTGDKKLCKGLKRRKFIQVINTEELKQILKGLY
jgi:predicted nucleic acid-binding protein